MSEIYILHIRKVWRCTISSGWSKDYESRKEALDAAASLNPQGGYFVREVTLRKRQEIR